MSSVNLQLPIYGKTNQGKEVLEVLGSEFSKTWNVVLAYDAAVAVAKGNGSLLQFQLALWNDFCVLGMELFRINLEWWSIPTTTKSEK